MPGWLADFFRFWWGLSYWNARKTFFRWRGGRCPCQNPSDSGRALETTCDACLHWHQAARFRRVCPLLVTTPNGLRCSVNTKDVRPFWGRAFGFYGRALVASWLAAVLIVFILLRGIGYPVHFASVAWLPARSARAQISTARGEYFFEKAQRALKANQMREGMLALSYAYQLDPHNYQAGLMLAKFWQAGLPAWSNQVYARLLHDDTAQSAYIAELWYRAMLARGDFAEIAQLMPGFIARDTAHAQVWMHAMFFATRHLGDTKPLLQLLDQGCPLAPDLRPLVEIELLVDTGRTNDAHQALHDLHADKSYNAYYQVSELTALGFPDDALAALNHNTNLLSQRDSFALFLDALTVKGRFGVVYDEVQQVLRAPTSAPAVEVLCTQFIRHPDPGLLAELFAKLRREPLPKNTESFQATAALFCAAGVNADWPDLQAARNVLKQLSGSNFGALDLLESFFHGQSAQSLESVLPILQPMPLDATYALFEHYSGKKITPAP
jgi:hypothetical protein